MWFWGFENTGAKIFPEKNTASKFPPGGALRLTEAKIHVTDRVPPTPISLLVIVWKRFTLDLKYYCMTWFYIGLILLAAFPPGLIIWRIRRHNHVRKNGTHVSGRVAGVKTFRSSKGGAVDILTVEYIIYHIKKWVLVHSDLLYYTFRVCDLCDI